MNHGPRPRPVRGPAPVQPGRYSPEDRNISRCPGPVWPRGGHEGPGRIMARGAVARMSKFRWQMGEITDMGAKINVKISKRIKIRYNAVKY